MSVTATRPTIAPPRDLADIERFATTLGNRLDRRPSLTTIAPYSEAFEAVSGHLNRLEDEVELIERDWHQYAGSGPRFQPATVEDPGSVSQLREGTGQIHEAVATLQTLASAALVAGPRSDVVLDPALVQQARDGVETLREIDLILQSGARCGGSHSLP